MIDEILKFRFEKKVVRKCGCWEWNAQHDNYGYGTITYGGKHYKAHRISYELYKTPIPEGLVIDHLCRNRGCVNPEHMEPVTIGENVKRGFRAMTHCKKGHDYGEAGVFIRSGRRRCKVCTRAGANARYHKTYKYKTH